MVVGIPRSSSVWAISAAIAFGWGLVGMWLPKRGPTGKFFGILDQGKRGVTSWWSPIPGTVLAEPLGRMAASSNPAWVEILLSVVRDQLDFGVRVRSSWLGCAMLLARLGGGLLR